MNPRQQHTISNDLLVLAVGHHTAFIAEQELTSCQACDELASVPFSSLVLELSGVSPSEAACILPRPNECPRCKAKVVETTLVRPLSPSRVAVEKAFKKYAG